MFSSGISGSYRKHCKCFHISAGLPSETQEANETSEAHEANETRGPIEALGANETNK